MKAARACRKKLSGVPVCIVINVALDPGPLGWGAQPNVALREQLVSAMHSGLHRALRGMSLNPVIDEVVSRREQVLNPFSLSSFQIKLAPIPRRGSAGGRSPACVAHPVLGLHADLRLNITGPGELPPGRCPPGQGFMSYPNPRLALTLFEAGPSPRDRIPHVHEHSTYPYGCTREDLLSLALSSPLDREVADALTRLLGSDL